MPIIVKRVRNNFYDWQNARYVVRVNDEPVLATFDHCPRDGIAECLRRAAAAIDDARQALGDSHE